MLIQVIGLNSIEPIEAQVQLHQKAQLDPLEVLCVKFDDILSSYVIFF